MKRRKSIYALEIRLGWEKHPVPLRHGGRFPQCTVTIPVVLALTIETLQARGLIRTRVYYLTGDHFEVDHRFRSFLKHAGVAVARLHLNTQDFRFASCEDKQRV